MNVDVATGELSAKEPMQLNEEKPIVANTSAEGSCKDNTPLMIVLSIISISLLVPIGVLISKIRSVNNDEATEMSAFESTQSKQRLKHALEAASEEASIKNEGQTPRAEE